MTTNEYAEVYKEETYEILEDLEKALLELESSPDDADLVSKIFRAIHTIKGSGAMFGFEMLSTFAHEVENAYELVRQGTLMVSKKLIDLTLLAMDFIKYALEMQNDKIGEAENVKKQTIITGLQDIIANAGTTEPINKLNKKPYIIQEPTAIEKPIVNRNPEPVAIHEEIRVEPPVEKILKEDKPDGPETTYRIRFIPSPSIQESGTNIIQLLKELKTLGTYSAVAHLANIPLLEEIEPTRCYVSWDIILTTSRPKNAILDVFIFVEEDSQIKVDVIDSADSVDFPDYKKVGNILVEKGDLSEEKIEAIVGHKKRLGELLVEEGIVDPEEVESALVEQQHVRDIRKKRQDSEVASSLRVSSEKMDQLVNLVGELVTLQARLSQLSLIRNDSQLISISEEVERITWELRDNSMDMRMLPIGSTFSRFKRLVRDLSNNLGKVVELTADGGDTELDKTVIERLNDPLVHIIRNCIDHGIEKPAQREAKGKIRTGTIHLNAFHSGSNVVIEVQDDGAGLDVKAIRKKAIERGLLMPDQELTDRDLFAIIFEPGFSTAKEVSDVSGRGVGMDVVKRNIEALRGSIDIESETGHGTTITLNIPLTLAIIDGLLVQIGQEFFVFPLSVVESCIEIEHAQIVGANGQNYVNVRGDLVPYIYLREQFDIRDNCPVIEQIVIATIKSQRVGFVVDHVVGGHQTVIKSLGTVYRHIDGLSGATILGDGTIALILDVPKLIMAAGLVKKKQRAFQKKNEDKFYEN